MVVSGFGQEVLPKRLMCGRFDLQLMESVSESIDLLMDIQLDGIIEMVMVEEPRPKDICYWGMLWKDILPFCLFSGHRKMTYLAPP